jgi:diguanylate cyclase (GGDEF)-like protein/PAS domain S-box-containing protein
MSSPGLLSAIGARGGWLVAALLTCVLVLSGWSPLKRLDLAAYDNIEPAFRADALAPASVVVAIDEATLSALGRWPWNRSVHAAQIDRLTASGVAAVGLSILFPEAAPGDTEFAEALAASRRVALALAPRTADDGLTGVAELLPVPQLAANAAALGHVDVELDADGLARRTFAHAGSGSAHWEALALATLKIANGEQPPSTTGIDTRRDGGLRLVSPHTPWVREGEILLPYPDAATAPRAISYFALLEQPELARRLKGYTVFIGATAGGIDGGLATPSSQRAQPMPAVEFHARTFEALRSNLTYVTTGTGITLGLSLLFLAIPAWLMGRMPLGGAIAMGGLVLVPPLASGLALNAVKLWLPPGAAMLGFLLGYLLWFAHYLKHTRGSLAHARHDADATLRSITDAVITVDEDTRVTMINPVAQRFSGLSHAEAEGRLIGDLLREFTDLTAGALGTVLASLKHRQAIRLPEPIPWRSPDGRNYALRLTATPVGQAGEGAVVVLNDVTETLAITARLQHEATHDLLTGLPNRALLLDRLHQALANAQRRGTLVALLFVDLDRFKRINDSLGHYAGDQVLQEVAARLQASVRAGDTVARWGGDEFIILMDNLHDRSAVISVARKLLDLLERELEAEGSTDLVLSGSVGISVGPQDSADCETLLSMADKAMYRGKIDGGASYTFYSPEMNTWSRDRLGIEAALRHGLANQEFELFYQPQVDIVSGQLAGLEALIRWHRPGAGLVRPDVFIGAAEETGIIRNIGEWAIREAAAQAARWSSEGLNVVPLSVNVSARQCLDMAIVDTIRQALADSGLNPSMLKVELTESTAMHDPERAAELLRRIDALGVGISVDDFGTGYSSLSLLKRFPISELKIDKSFVGDIAGDNDDAAIVRGTIALAHGLGMKVVAEGVETEPQLGFLAKHGCNLAQGYLFAQPLPTAEIRGWLALPPPHAFRAIRKARLLQ